MVSPTTVAVVRKWRKPRPRRIGPRRRKSPLFGDGWRTQSGSVGFGKPRTSLQRRRSPGVGRLMSRSKKWRLEWAFFPGENVRLQYNKLCKGCVHPCKQCCRAVVLSCLRYLSRRSKNSGITGQKREGKPLVAVPLFINYNCIS